ncbi:MAG: uracil-DNA glycosylase family protein [Chloroflexia bacterium]
MADGSGSAALETASLKALEERVKVCQLCRLAKTRTKAVPGEGDAHAEVMFIGEGPGYHEDKQGRPFVGAAGQFLNELLHIAGLDRQGVYITNVVKCRPPNNRDPEPEEKAACAPYLERQLALINPAVIVTLGRHSMARFFPGELISRIHGTARMVDGRLAVAMYHPAAGLHQASLADIIRADFRKLPVYIEQARIMSQPPPEVLDAQVAGAEAAREQVIHEPETAAVLESDFASPGAPQVGEKEPETKDALLTQDMAEGTPQEEPGEPDELDNNDQYKQLSFFS